MSGRRILSVAPDLFFAARIVEVAKALGLELLQAGPAGAFEVAKREAPDLIVMDLHATGDPLAQVRALRGDPATRAIPVVGFYSHVDEATRLAALAAGVTQVMPRSQFTRRLPELLAGG
jgi:CheY-like chemotaxis protein